MEIALCLIYILMIYLILRNNYIPYYMRMIQVCFTKPKTRIPTNHRVDNGWIKCCQELVHREQTDGEPGKNYLHCAENVPQYKSLQENLIKAGNTCLRNRGIHKVYWYQNWQQLVMVTACWKVTHNVKTTNRHAFTNAPNIYSEIY